MKILIGLCISFITFGFTITHHLDKPLNNPSELPKVFLLGEHEEAYEKLVENYATSLLSACNNDMNKAFKKWISMNQEMEVYADQITYNTDGLKLWLHVFWAKDGSIKHIGYYLRPNSKNADLTELNAFLFSFMNHYKFPLIAHTPYSHYSFVQFPMTPQKIKVD